MARTSRVDALGVPAFAAPAAVSMNAPRIGGIQRPRSTEWESKSAEVNRRKRLPYTKVSPRDAFCILIPPPGIVATYLGAMALHSDAGLPLLRPHYIHRSGIQTSDMNAGAKAERKFSGSRSRITAKLPTLCPRFS
jgi:hypothetical protein